MKRTAITSLKSHFDEVDYNRHVNGAAYERYANHARHEILAEMGWDPAVMLRENFRSRPIASRMQFSRQQDAGTSLEVHTEASFESEGRVHWKHDIRNQGKGESACNIEMLSVLEQNGVPGSNFPGTPEVAGDASAEFKDFAPFQNDCERIELRYRTRYADQNYFSELPPSVIWKLIEECRQLFAEQVGLTAEQCLAHDVLLFTSAGEYRFHEPVPAATELKISVWLDELGKIRCGMRHEIALAETGEILHTARESFIVVAPSKMKPRRAPEFMLNAVNEFLAPPTPR